MIFVIQPLPQPMRQGLVVARHAMQLRGTASRAEMVDIELPMNGFDREITDLAVLFC